MPEPRNVLVESARLARGDVKPLNELKASDFDALFIPGGFGAAKNLSDFGFKGANMTVQADVEAALKDFHGSKRPIGLCCIAPVVAAKVFGKNSGGPGVKLTLGARGENWPYNGSIDAANSFGNTMEEKQINETSIDTDNKIVSAPAYMKGDAKPHEVFDSVANMVDEVEKLL
uniref:DJ-1/PfpI domain-containing protein n=1 Tax=Strombidinopsis acuminata TaxID=141414 RepID=A0A7S3RSD6_9SPIT|mmetsp:Transcript_117557/g.163711  ORF Transcript_117557/g.163711 Transcript_117557/m.163711 type:complete len:173 (+) Transcript_117557:246-764(+)